MGDRLTLRKSSVWPTVSFILGGAVVFLIGFLSLHSMIRSHAEPSKAPASQPMQVALASTGTAPGGTPLAGTTVVKTIRITPESVGAPAASPVSAATAAPSSPALSAATTGAARQEPRGGAWAMARPPTWLATVDPEAGLGIPSEINPSAAVADTLPRPEAVALAAVTALALPVQLAQAVAAEETTVLAQIEDVPLPRVRPKPPTRTKVSRKRSSR